MTSQVKVGIILVTLTLVGLTLLAYLQSHSTARRRSLADQSKRINEPLKPNASSPNATDRHLPNPEDEDASTAFSASIAVSLRNDSLALVPYPSRVVIRGDQLHEVVTLAAPEGRWKGELINDNYQVVAVEGAEDVPLIMESASISRTSRDVLIIVEVSNVWHLEVVDAVDGRQLIDVSISSIDPGDEMNSGLLALDKAEGDTDLLRSSIIRTGTASPLTIAENDSKGLFLASAPGHLSKAFKRNRFQKNVTISLVPGGTLSVKGSTALDSFLTGLRDSSSNEVQPVLGIASPSSRTKSWETDVRAGFSGVARSVPVGNAIVTLEVRGEFGTTMVFKKAVAIAAGMESTVSLTPIPQEPPPPLSDQKCRSITATVILPQRPEELPKELRAECSLQLSKLQDGEWGVVNTRSVGSVPGEQKDLGPFHFNCLSSGAYRIAFLPTGRHVDCHLGTSDQQLILECSDLCFVRIVKTPESNCAGQVRIPWSYSNQSLRGFGGHVAIKEEGGLIICQPSPIFIQLVGDECSSTKELVTPVPNALTTFSLTVDPSPVAFLRITTWRNGSHPLLGHEFWKDMVVSPVGHEGQLLSMRFGAMGTSAKYGQSTVEPDWSQVILVLSSPGRYRIRFPDTSEVARDVVSGVNETSVVLQ